MTSAFGSAWPIVQGAADAFRPPRRVSVAEGAQQNLMIVQPGGYTGLWSAAETPYMVEPMNMLASRRHESVVFVGPARSGKTLGLLDAWMTYVVTCDPGDFLCVQMTQDKARDYSKTRIDRAIRHSPALANLMSTRGHDDNTHDKLFRHGMWLKIGWPSATQLSSSDYRYVALTDYDRMPDNIDGEGSAYGLGVKRTTTFLSRGMCMAESSPGRTVTDPNYRLATAHEAPPCGGILGIYNRGDRRRLYWPCPHCGEYFQAEPGLGLFARLPGEDELLQIVRTADLQSLADQYAVICCPHCGCEIDASHKYQMNQASIWLRDGEIAGHPETGIQSSIASYWLGGVAAAYQSWHNLLLRYLQGLRSFASSGEEESLKVTTNTDQAMPYLPRAMRDEQKRQAPSELAEDFPRYVVPEQARFLVAAVDVQGGSGSRFVVQVHAVGPDLEQWMIDRYEIRESMREGICGGYAPIDPASYPEDWDLITERVLRCTYKTHIDGQELRVLRVVVDSGGEDGVTENAYKWWQDLAIKGMGGKAVLYKGGSVANAPVIAHKKVGAKKNISLLMSNANLLKDAVHNASRRDAAGNAKLHFPRWVGAAFWDELQAEVRLGDGKYKKIRKRNESLDLCCMIRAALLWLGADRLSWRNPPAWAAPVVENSERESRDERRERKAEAQAGNFKKTGGFVRKSFV